MAYVLSQSLITANSMRNAVSNLTNQSPSELERSSTYLTDIYHPITEVHQYNTSSTNKGNLQIPLTNLRAGHKAISVSGARVRNNIPDGI